MSLVTGTIAPVALLFAVVDAEFGSSWRVWVNKNDVDLVPRPMGDRLSLSLHAARWRLAFTEEH